MFLRNLGVILASLFIFTSCQTVSSQSGNVNSNKVVIEIDESQFYQNKMLKDDFKQADAVIYVDIKERTLVDFIGEGDCENNKGKGYCLYRLKAEVMEVFKGNINEKEVEFYTSPDADYPKEYLMGERVVFLRWSEDKKNLGTMENSTRWIKYDVLKKLRKIAEKK